MRSKGSRGRGHETREDERRCAGWRRQWFGAQGLWPTTWSPACRASGSSGSTITSTPMSMRARLRASSPTSRGMARSCTRTHTAWPTSARRRPMTEDSYFYVYSMTKPVTSVALLMLYEEGKFQLNEPIARYLPELANARVFDRETGRVVDAVRQPTIAGRVPPHRGLSLRCSGRDRLRSCLRARRVSSAPTWPSSRRSSASCRSAISPARAGSTRSRTTSRRGSSRCSRASRSTNSCRERILEPLGMKETVFGRPDRLEGPVRGHLHRERQRHAGAERRARCARRGDACRSAASACPRPRADYARFAEMLVNDGELDGVRILSRKTIDLMASNHLPDGVTRGAAGGGHRWRRRLRTRRARRHRSGESGQPHLSGRVRLVRRCGHALLRRPRGGSRRRLHDPEDGRRWPADVGGMSDEFETLVYQAIVD